VACLVEDKEPPVSGIDGRIPVVLGMAAWKSCQENRPVKISEVATS
jgi:myo-inositol 2-dehydrogenase/D-chiro-inositol 1-dehydrogenase